MPMCCPEWGWETYVPPNDGEAAAYSGLGDAEGSGPENMYGVENLGMGYGAGGAASLVAVANSVGWVHNYIYPQTNYRTCAGLTSLNGSDEYQ